MNRIRSLLVIVAILAAFVFSKSVFAEDVGIRNEEIISEDTAESKEDTNVIVEENTVEADKNTNDIVLENTSEDIAESETEESITDEENNENSYITFYPEDIPVYGDYENGIAPMTVEDYTTGVVTTYKRLDMFNPDSVQGYTVLNTGIKYFSSDNNSSDANYLGLKRVVYCMEYSRSSPNVGYDFSYTYLETNVYRPEVYIMANGVRYLNQECINSKFRTGLGADYDYYVTQMALHLARGEFSYDYFKERMLSRNSGVSDTVKNKVLECIYNLYAYGVNITTDPCMFYLYGTDNQNSILMNISGATHSLANVSSKWTQNSAGNWVTPVAVPVSTDYYGGDLRPYYRNMTVTTDVAGVNVYQYSLNGGVISQGFYLYCSDATYKSLQKTGATINVTCKLTFPNVFAGRVLDFAANSTYQDVEYYGALTDWGNADASVKAVYTVEKTETYGNVYLQKTSANTSITNDNSCYSLSGAEYTVYANAACTVSKGTLITTSTGKSNTLKLATGTYYVKETKVPQGYVLDDTVYKVVLTSAHESSPYVLKVSDEPQAFPMELLLKKVDEETLESSGRGHGTLKGGQFTVKYYDILEEKDPAESGYEPVKTWVFQTDENGYIYFDQSSYFVKGDDLYQMVSGAVCIPIGTITIQETQSPEGYRINETIYIKKISAELIESGITAYAVPIIPESILKLNLLKIQDETELGIGQVEFEHTRPNGEIENLETDKNGELEILGLETGQHILKESAAPGGYLLNQNEICFTVNDDHSIVIESDAVETEQNGNILISINTEGNLEIVVEDKVSPFDLQIVKKNTKGIVLSDVEFTIYEDENCQSAVETQVTDKDGMLTIKNLLVGKTYYVKETKAPTGYKLPEIEQVIKISTNACPVENMFEFSVNDERFTANDTDTEQKIYVSGDPSNRIIHLEIENTTGYVLPETGSVNTVVLVLIGSLYMLYALGSGKIKTERN